MSEIGAYVLNFNRSGKYYIGSTGNLSKRINIHEYLLRHNRHSNTNVQSLWNNECRFSVLFYPTDTVEEARVLEQELIDQNRDDKKMVNIGLGVRGGDNITRHPRREEIINKIATTLERARANMTPKERALVWGKYGEKNGMWGRTHTEEVKKRLGELKRGNDYAKGAVRSEETKRILSEKASKRTGEKNSFYGRHHNSKTKEILSKANMGNKPPNTKQVMIDGELYPSATEAGRQLGVVTATILHRIHSPNPKYTGYFYATESPTTSESTERIGTSDE